MASYQTFFSVATLCVAASSLLWGCDDKKEVEADIENKEVAAIDQLKLLIVCAADMEVLNRHCSDELSKTHYLRLTRDVFEKLADKSQSEQFCCDMMVQSNLGQEMKFQQLLWETNQTRDG